MTEDEELEDDLTGALRFDIALLTARLGVAIRWAKDSEGLLNRRAFTRLRCE